MTTRAIGTFAVLAVLAGVAAGCGSSTDTSTGASATTVPATASAPTTAPSPTTTAGSTALAKGPVPAVSGATDLKKEPTIHAGTGAAPTALVGKDLAVGTGTEATATSTVTVAYVGALFTTGKVFDASWTDGSGTPVSFALNEVVPGFKDGIIGMRVGGRREVVIPPAYGYGSNANGPIPANSTLVFVIDLVKVS